MRLQHIIVLRHGETDLSSHGLFVGSNIDAPLNEKGEASAAEWRSSLAGLTGLHSPLRRAAETARIAGLASASDLDLREWDLGDLEGIHAESYRKDHGDWQLFRDGAPGGESPDMVAERAARLLDRVRSIGTEVVCLVGHGQFNKLLATRILEVPVEYAAMGMWGPCRAAVFSWRSSREAFMLAGWNRTPTNLGSLIGGNS